MDNGKIVAFQTVNDYLHTCKWYHENEPYIKKTHYACLVGYDDQYFFYTDSPGMRNPEYFIAHPANPAVGCIPREELCKSFEYHCKIGYFDINEKAFINIANVKEILIGIRGNYKKSCTEYYIGRAALIKLADLLSSKNDVTGILDDSFSFDLFASRHKRLMFNIRRYQSLLKPNDAENLAKQLNVLVDCWRRIENMVCKYMIKKDILIQNRISQIIQREIIPLTDIFMSYDN